MKIEVDELNNHQYFLEDKLIHSELQIFINEKIKPKKKWFYYLYLISLICSSAIASYTITKFFISEELSINYIFMYIFLGIITSMVLIPIHEMIHYLAYKMKGAKSVTFIANFKKVNFATIADKFVTNLNEFSFIALSPFFIILIATLLSFPFLSPGFQLTAMVSLFIHNIFCIGDLTLLNYMASNKGMVTYDDKEKGETYFYKKQQI